MMTLRLLTKSALKNFLISMYNSAHSVEDGEITAPMIKALLHVQFQATVSIVDRELANHYTNSMSWNAKLTLTRSFAKSAKQKERPTTTILPAWQHARQLDQHRGLPSLLLNTDSAYTKTGLSLTSLAGLGSKGDPPWTY